jgi:hypothetical protein
MAHTQLQWRWQAVSHGNAQFNERTRCPFQQVPVCSSAQHVEADFLVKAKLFKLLHTVHKAMVTAKDSKQVN